tara:strand:+ start:479 stop:733 length:255 start_codon:yes stop_codon:yes gene_type:complete
MEWIMVFKPVTYQSKYYHNTHSEKRDEFLIEEFGEEWLKDMKAKGHFGGEHPLELVGKPKGKNWRSSPVIGEEVDLDASGTQKD